MTAMWPVEQMNDVFLFCNIKTDISLLKTSHIDLYSLIGSAYPYRFKNFFLVKIRDPRWSLETGLRRKRLLSTSGMAHH